MIIILEKLHHFSDIPSAINLKNLELKFSLILPFHRIHQNTHDMQKIDQVFQDVIKFNLSTQHQKCLKKNYKYNKVKENLKMQRQNKLTHRVLSQFKS